MGKLITRITSEQRMDMIMKGLSPASDRDIQKYVKGELPSLQERAKKATVLTGGMRTASSNEQEITLPTGDFSSGNGEMAYLGNVDKYESGNYSKPAQSSHQSQRSLQRQMIDDMNQYEESAGKVFKSDDLLSFKKRSINEAPMENTGAEAQGYANAREYLNAFVINLQNENYSSSFNERMKLYKALKKCLEEENKLKNDSSSLQAYKKGVLRAEKAMLQKMQ